MRTLFYLLIALLSILTLPAPVSAGGTDNKAAEQTGVGGIDGKIMGNMEAVKGAEVVLMQHDQLVDKTQTDADGHYFFKYLNPGSYDIKATKPGYRTSIIITIAVTADNTTPNDFYLPMINNAHMIKTPIVETYEENYHRYMRHK